MRRTLLTLSLLTLAAAPAWAAGDSPGAAAPGSRPVLVVRFLGLPADSVARRDMLAGFRDEMNAAALRCEKRVGTEWVKSDTVANAFQFVDVAPPDEAWTLELSVRVPQPVRALVMTQQSTKKEEAQLVRPRMSNISSSRGLVVAATAAPPVRHGRRADFEPVPSVVSLYFADARRIVVPSPNLPGGGYLYPWADAGRVVARAALEALHRTSGALDAARRADLAPATRVAEAQPE